MTAEAAVSTRFPSKWRAAHELPAAIVNKQRSLFKLSLRPISTVLAEYIGKGLAVPFFSKILLH